MTDPTPVPTTNQPAQDAVTLIENLGKMGEQAAEAAIIADVPAMGTPVLKRVWEAAFDWLLMYILRPAASLGGQVVIDIEQYVALKDAVAAQAALDAAKKTGDSSAITQASQAVDVAIAGALHYVGATTS